MEWDFNQIPVNSSELADVTMGKSFCNAVDGFAILQLAVNVFHRLCGICGQHRKRLRNFNPRMVLLRSL